MSDLFALGDYAAFVWPAYGVTVLGLGGVIAFTLRAYLLAKARLSALERK